jgi:hypothetical protein
VGVAVQDRTGLLVAHHRLDDVDRRSLGDKPGRIAVARIMERRPLHHARAGKRGQPHPLAEVGPAQRPPALVAEHQLIQLGREPHQVVGQIAAIHDEHPFP